MRKLVVLAGIVCLSLLSVNAHAQSFAFGWSDFTSSNNIAVNGTPYYNTYSGWSDSNGNHYGENTNYFSGEFDCGGSNVCRNFFSFDLSSLTGNVNSASFTVYTYGVTVPGPYQIYGTALTPGQVSTDFSNVSYWQALASGPMVGSIALAPSDSYNNVTINFNQAGLAWLQSNEGNGVVLGGEFLGGPVSPTPEPGSLILLGSGLIGGAGLLRRKLGL